MNAWSYVYVTVFWMLYTGDMLVAGSPSDPSGVQGLGAGPREWLAVFMQGCISAGRRGRRYGPGGWQRAGRFVRNPYLICREAMRMTRGTNAETSPDGTARTVHGPEAVAERVP